MRRHGQLYLSISVLSSVHFAEHATDHSDGQCSEPDGKLTVRRDSKLRKRTAGSALLEFAIVLPLLVVFVVGIYDFSGAFNQKQKISHAAQEGAILAGAQPMTDMDPANPNPDSLQPVLESIFNSLSANNVLPPGGNLSGCTVTPTYVSGLKWSYAISGCTQAFAPK